MPNKGLERPASRNSIVYCVYEGKVLLRPCVSGMEFDRGIAAIVRVAEDIKSAIFPDTVRVARNGAFEKSRALVSVVLNVQLEALGECGSGNGERHHAVFGAARIRQLILPPALRVLGDNAFYQCRELQHVVIQERSALEKIGRYCFSESGIKTITVPKTLRTVGAGAFRNCENLRIVQVEDGC